jgi:hypothetical protein
VITSLKPSQVHTFRHSLLPISLLSTKRQTEKVILKTVHRHVQKGDLRNASLLVLFTTRCFNM